MADDANHMQLFKLLNTTVKEDESPEFSVPPSIPRCEEYLTATSTGYVKNVKKGRERLSMMFIDNVPFKYCGKINKFAQMGIGYCTLFMFAIFAVILIVCPFLFLGVTAIHKHSTGTSCYTQEQIEHWDKIMARRLNGFSSKAYEKDTELKIDDETKRALEDQRKTLSMFFTMNCLTSLFDKKCKEIKRMGCQFSEESEKDESPECVKALVDFYKERFQSMICRKSILTIYSSGNKLNDEPGNFYDKWIRWIYVFGMVVSFIVIIGLYKYHNMTDVKLDMKFGTINDVSLRLYNIPKGLDNAQKSVTDAFKSLGFEVVQVNLIFKVGQFMKMKDDYYELYTKRALDNANPDQTEKSLLLDSATAKIGELKTQIEGKEMEYDLGNTEDFIGEAFVSFVDTTTKEKVQELFEPKGFLWRNFGMKGKLNEDHPLILHDKDGTEHEMYVEEAPEPVDVLWANQGTSAMSLLIRKFASFFLSILIIIADIALIYTLKIVGKNLMHKNNSSLNSKWTPYLDIVINLFISSVIFLVDFILQFILRTLVNLEKPLTVTNQHLYTAKKIWKMSFLTSGLVPLLLSLNFFNFFGPNGLVSSVNSILLINTFMSPSLSLMGNPWIIIKHFQRNQLRKKAEKGEFIHKTQGQANMIFERANYQMMFKYPVILKNTALALFFLPMVPWTPIYTLLLIGFWYWAEKFVLVKFSNKKQTYSAYISRKLIPDLELCVDLFGIGVIVNDVLIELAKLNNPHLRWEHIVILVLVAASMFLNFTKFIANRFMQLKKATGVPDTYIDIKNEDPNDYDISNPATSVMSRKIEYGMEAIGFQKLPANDMMTFFNSGGDQAADSDDDDAEPINNNVQGGKTNIAATEISSGKSGAANLNIELMKLMKH